MTYFASLAIDPLQEPLVITQGDTIRVSVSITYSGEGAEPAKLTLQGAIGSMQGSTFNPVNYGNAPIELVPSPVNITVQASVDIKTGGNTPASTYDLYVKLHEYPELNDMVGQCVTVQESKGILGNISEMIGMMMMVMMMGMIMPMMTEE